MQKTKENFSEWLNNKTTSEYWDGQITDKNYAFRTQERLKNLLISGDLFPEVITLFVTNTCNLLCDHCGQSSGKPMQDELTLQEIYNLIPQLQNLRVKLEWTENLNQNY